MAVKSRPVVGVEVRAEPSAEVAANWRVFEVSVLRQVDPTTNNPELHSVTITGVPISTVPVKSTPAGVSTV